MSQSLTNAPSCQKHGLRKVRVPSRTGFHCLKCRAERDRNSHLKRTFGITLEEYERMLARQKNKCRLCRRARVDGENNFHVDHDEDSGAVRGILCHNCNTLLGHAKEQPRILRRAAAYLESPVWLDEAAEKILEEWTRKQLYVYFRTLDSRFTEPTSPFRVQWAITVEYRGLGWKQLRGEGYNISKIIKDLNQQLPAIEEPKLPPRQSPPRPTETRRIAIKSNPGRIKVSKQLLDESRAIAESMPENGVTRKRRKKPARARRK